MPIHKLSQYGCLKKIRSAVLYILFTAVHTFALLSSVSSVARSYPSYHVTPAVATQFAE